MKSNTLLIVTAAVFALAGCSTSPSTEQRANRTDKPNVIIIYTDDQGTLDMNNYGSKDLQTPNMDRLATEGTKFTQFYAASPVCSPSRAALMTGKSPYKCGLGDNASSVKGEKKGLPQEEKTIAEYMKEEGYSTALIGKWHLGYSEGMTPNDQGFDYQFGHMGGCIDNYSHYFYWKGPNAHDLYRNNEEVWYDGQFFPDLMEKEAAQFISDNKDHPFFLYYAFNMPHYPLQGSEKWREAYKDLPSPRKEYAAFLSSLDDKVGSILDQLDELGLRENTIVIFQSDHGHSTEVRTFNGGGNAGPYRGAKFSLFEGGIRVPAIISWPGKIPSATVRDQLAVNIDWLPTILDYMGHKPSENIEGLSLRSVIEDNKETPHPSFAWRYAHMWAVRKGDWKLLYKPIDPVMNLNNPWKMLPDQDSLFLVNLKEDAGERVNIAIKHPTRVTELKNIYQNWLTK